MKIIGQYGTDGNYQAYTKKQTVYRFGNTLRDTDGIVVAVKDEYGDFVSPTMKRLGLKSKIETEE